MKKFIIIVIVIAAIWVLISSGIIDLSAPSDNTTPTFPDFSFPDSNVSTDPSNGSSVPTPNESEPTNAATTPEEATDPTNGTPEDGLRPEFKAAMDSYEAFYDEYCDFMIKYQESPTDFSLIMEYTQMLQRAIDMDEAFEKWESEELTNEELKYYLDVSARITKKLLDIAQ